MWDELRQCAVVPERRGHDGYRRPDPRHCHNYGPEPVRKPNHKIAQAITKMECIFANRAAKKDRHPLAETMGLEALAQDEAGF